MIETSNQIKNLCEICCAVVSKYSCPKCNTLYCSLDCYKSEAHSQCSEGFYKNQVKAHLSQEKPSKEEATEITRIIKEHYESLIEDGSVQPDIYEKILEIEQNDFDFRSIWSALDQTEKDEFKQLFFSESLSQQAVDLIDYAAASFNPWWDNSAPLIQEIDECNSNSGDPVAYNDGVSSSKNLLELEDGIDNYDQELGDSNSDSENSESSQNHARLVQQPYQIKKLNYEPVPNIWPKIEEFSRISKIAPNPIVLNTLVGIILSYVITNRTFQGEMDSYCIESIRLLNEIYPPLFAKIAPTSGSLEEQLVICLQNAENIEGKLLYLEDLIKVLRFPSGVLASLSDLYQHFLLCQDHCAFMLAKKQTNDTDTKRQNKKTQKMVISASKRAYYYMSLVASRPNDQNAAAEINTSLNANAGANESAFGIGRMNFEQTSNLVEVYMLRLKQESQELVSHAQTIVRVGGEQGGRPLHSAKIEILN